MSKIKQYIADVYGEDADLELLSQEREEQDGNRQIRVQKAKS